MGNTRFAATRAFALALFLVVGNAASALAQEPPIAGLNPSVRPPDPVITEYAKTADWYALALRGVAQPYPASLHFLENQGAWFSPFIHPGMTGPYDIRGWHAAVNSSAN